MEDDALQSELADADSTAEGDDEDLLLKLTPDKVEGGAEAIRPR